MNSYSNTYFENSRRFALGISPRKTYADAVGGAAAMADGVLLLLGQFGKRLAGRRGQENRVVREAAVASFAFDDRAFDRALGGELAAVGGDEVDGTDEPRRAIGGAGGGERLAQQPAAIGPGGGFTPVARAEHARRAAEGREGKSWTDVLSQMAEPVSA